MKNRPAHSFVQMAPKIARLTVLMVLVSLISCVTHGTIVVNDESLAPATLIIRWAESGALYVDDEPFGQIVAGEAKEIQTRKDGDVTVRIVRGTSTWATTITVYSGQRVEVADFNVVDLSAPIHNEIFISGGTFQMGTPSGGEDNERPVHTVRLDDFLMMTTEVTFDAYDAFARETGRDLPADQGWGRGDRPLLNVSWYDAIAFANWLSEQDGLYPAYQTDGESVTWDRDADGWRLPTEAEWEFAARGGTQSGGYTYAGSNVESDVAWYFGNSADQTHPVGQLLPNEMGLYDMSGNVWEWCWDWYDDYISEAQTNPTGPASGNDRVKRGGGWHNIAPYLRSACRNGSGPGDWRSIGNVGFRLVRSVVW